MSDDPRGFYGMQCGDYRIEQLITHARTNSYVFSASSETQRGKFVFKYLRPEIGAEAIRRELMMVQCVMEHCPNAVRGFDFVQVGNSYGYFMKYYTRNDLWDFVQRNQLSDDTIRRMSYRIMIAIRHLHETGYIHRDIKPSNIFVDGDGEPETYLGDFGLTIRQEDVLREHPAGTLDYAAPELLQGYRYDKSVDIWAAGATLFTMFTGRVPFADPENIRYYLEDIRSCGWLERAPEDIPDDARDLISQMMRLDPSERISADQILEHPFYASMDLVRDTKRDIGDIADAYDEGMH